MWQRAVVSIWHKSCQRRQRVATELAGGHHGASLIALNQCTWGALRL